MNVTRGKLKEAERVVIYASEGWGKSTLASLFPNPLFIDIEGSTAQLDVARAPHCDSWALLMGTISSLTKDRAGFETLVIDTGDWAERMCSASVCAKGQKEGIEDFGYGKGFVYLAEEWGRFLDALTILSKTGMHIVILAHATTRKFELPEEEGAFDRYEMKLAKGIAPLCKEWATMLLFGAFKTIVEVDDKTKKAKGHGSKRVIRTEHAAAWDAKNRHGLPAEIAIVDKVLPAPLAAIFSSTPATKPTLPSIPSIPQPPAEPVAESSAPDTPPASTAQAKLMAMMEHSGVTYVEVNKVMAALGHWPMGTNINALDEQYITGRLLPAWPKVVTNIMKGRAA